MGASGNRLAVDVILVTGKRLRIVGIANEVTLKSLEKVVEVLGYRAAGRGH